MPTDRLSRKFARALRDDPEVPMQRGGWVSVTDLMHRLGISRADLEEVLAASSR